MITLDGFFEGENNDISWHNAANYEFNDFVVEYMKDIDTLIFGRKTYQLMASYWPLEETIAEDPKVSEIMNGKQKYVFSKTLNQVSWENTNLINHDAAEYMKQLKQNSKGDLILLGSANLATSLIKSNLIDEYRLMINPVAIGKGRALFQDLEQPLRLKLTDTRKFNSGNVQLTYQPL